MMERGCWSAKYPSTLRKSAPDHRSGYRNITGL